MNSILNKGNKSPNHIRVNNDLTDDPSTICNAFSQHFSSVCSSLLSDPPYSHAPPNIPRRDNSFSFRTIYPRDVERAIRDLKSGSGVGPDGLDMRFIKIAPHILAYPLSDLFNLSLSTGEVPSSWKCARVTPLHKGSDPHDLNNYRPISIINSIVKIFEKLIFNQLSNYLNDFNILSPSQSGFRPKFSTTTTLLKFTNDVFSSFGDSMSTGAIFIDLSKAFDMVDHYLLLDKLYAIGLSRQALLWFNSYLHHRRQCVSYQGSQSDFVIMDKGVPQGSSLGPLLFSIFINDLPTICSNSHIQLYADDTIIYCSNPNIAQIQQTLQADFNSVQEWFYFNRLLLNRKKSVSMLFSLRPDSLSLSFKFSDGTPLEVVEEFKYLGLWLDPQLSFKTHINSTIQKINYSLKVLYRSIHCFTLQTRTRIISQLILPILDYGDIVYQNTTDTILYPLNVTYHNLCRFILKCPYRTHHCSMYESLNWLSLKSRRHFHWMQFIFKCIFSNYPPYLKQYLDPYTAPYNLRHTVHPYFKVPSNTTLVCGRRAFKFKAPADWNDLPSSLRSISSLNLFKESLFTHLQTPCSCF